METEVEINEINEKDSCENRKPTKFDAVCGLLTGILFILATIAYLLLGFLLGIWHPTWLVFLAPIVISSLVLAIGKKDANLFSYPVFVVTVYILLSSLFGLWHPLWVVFITIPIYYSFIKFIKELKNK